MPRYYPIYLDVQGRLAVVFGGDHEAERKVRFLRECGARVVLVSPESCISPALLGMVRSGEIDWRQRGYRAGDLEGAWLAIVAETSDDAVNRAVYDEARERNVVLNVMDVTHLCTFIAPAIVQRHDVTAAISTAGTSPALARRLRERMSDEEYCRCLNWAELGPILADVRAEVRARGIPLTPEDWQACMNEETLARCMAGDTEGARAELIGAMEARVAGRGG